MKKLIIAFSVLAALSHLAPIICFAEPTHPNEIGLYMTPDGYGATGTYVVGSPVDVYLVLTRPYYVDNNGVPYTALNQFDCQLNFNPIGNLFKLYQVYPAPGLNVGDVDNINLGYLEYIVGFSGDLPITSELVLLVTIRFLHTAQGVIEVTLGPVSFPMIPGEICFRQYPQEPEMMHPISGSPDAPVFLFGGEAVPVETKSFGSVKALYR
jgi:hypothetical protein